MNAIRSMLACGAALLALAAPFATQAQAATGGPVRIGFISTLSGPGGALGADIRDGFMLGIRHAGGKLGGLPVDLSIADDQQKPDVGVQVAQRMVQQHRAHFVTGVVFSNVLLPIAPAILDSRTFYISPNTGPTEYAGAKCHPFFFVTSWQSEDVPAAMGKFVNSRGFDNVMLLAANYAGGRESLAGFKREYKGKISDEVYTALGQLDYSAELATIAAKKPPALFVFLPGGMGINFIKQFAGAGLSRHTQLVLPGYSADEDTIRPVGPALLGTINSSQWAHDLDNPANRRFVADFEREYGRLPTMYASQGYDTAMLIDSAIRRVKGNLEDKEALRRALLAADFKSVRGAFKFNRNQYPIQDFYLRIVRKDEQGRITNRTIGKIFENHADPFAADCRM